MEGSDKEMERMLGDGKPLAWFKSMANAGSICSRIPSISFSPCMIHGERSSEPSKENGSDPEDHMDMILKITWI